jgi:hypothetical protein
MGISISTLPASQAQALNSSLLFNHKSLSFRASKYIIGFLFPALANVLDAPCLEHQEESRKINQVNGNMLIIFIPFPISVLY